MCVSLMLLELTQEFHATKAQGTNTEALRRFISYHNPLGTENRSPLTFVVKLYLFTPSVGSLYPCKISKLNSVSPKLIDKIKN